MPRITAREHYYCGIQLSNYWFAFSRSTRVPDIWGAFVAQSEQAHQIA
jgi:hypothetical protein